VVEEVVLLVVTFTAIAAVQVIQCSAPVKHATEEAEECYRRNDGAEGACTESLLILE